jgi:hypothetical protein
MRLNAQVPLVRWLRRRAKNRLHMGAHRRTVRALRGGLRREIPEIQS